VVRNLQYAGYLLLEVLCLLCALLGVWLIYPPAALILGGITGLLGAERAMALSKATQGKGASR
jgi:hypothetical protein